MKVEIEKMKIKGKFVGHNLKTGEKSTLNREEEVECSMEYLVRQLNEKEANELFELIKHKLVNKEPKPKDRIEPLGKVMQFWCKGYDPTLATVHKLWDKVEELIRHINKES